MKLHRFGTSLPFVKPFVAFIAGIALAEATGIYAPAVLVLLLIAGALVLHRLRRSSNSFVFLKSIALLVAIAAAGSYLLHEASQPVTSIKEGFYRGQVKLVNDIRCTDHQCGTLAYLNIAHHDGEITPVRVRFSFPLDTAKQLTDGCTCHFEGTLKQYQIQRNPYSFDGARYAFENGLAGRMVVSEYHCMPGERSARTRGRQALRKTLEQIENPEVAAVFYALLSGDKTDLSESTRTHFARCGIMHLLAVSGLHVGLIAWLPLFMLRITYRKKLRLFMALLVVLLVWSFAWFTGMSASVMRASAMISLMAVGMAFRKKVSTLNSLAAVGLFMLISAPRLLFNAGFLLSFSAVAAIVLWTPIITERFFLRSPFKRYLLQSSAVAITAQAGTSPISVYYFKQLPLLFLPANLIAVPLATFTLYLLLATLIIEAIGVSPGWLYLALNVLGNLLLLTAEYIGEMPFAAIESIEVSLTEALLYTLFTALVFLHWAHPTKKRSASVIALAGVLLVLAHFRQDHRIEVILFSSYGDPLIGLTGRSSAHVLLWDERQSTFAAQSWSTHSEAQFLIMQHQLDTVVCGIPLKRRGDWLQLGPLVIGRKKQVGTITEGDYASRLVLPSGEAVLISGERHQPSIDVSRHALAARINSDGTIGKWYDRRKLPSRLPLP